MCASDQQIGASVMVWGVKAPSAAGELLEAPTAFESLAVATAVGM